jgi:hypothetical protein
MIEGVIRGSLSCCRQVQMTCNSQKTTTKPIGAPSSHKIVGICFAIRTSGEHVPSYRVPQRLRLSRLEFAETRLRYCPITLAVEPPVIIVKPAPHASLIFSLIILLASARAGDPPAASFANLRVMTWFDSTARAKKCSQGLFCDLMPVQVSMLWGNATLFQSLQPKTTICTTTNTRPVTPRLLA